MKKIIFCSILLLSMQAFANINCNQQYGGEYNCYNYETGQMQTIEINQYPINDVRPVQMPDLSSLPDPTPMMHMDSGQINDMFNPQPIAPMTIQPSPSANMALQNAQQQANAQIAELDRMQQQQLQALEQRRIEEQRAYEFNMQLAQQMRAQKAQQELASRQLSQDNVQNTGYGTTTTTSQNYPSNIDSDSNNSNIKNLIIGLLLLVVVVMLGLFFQRNG